MELWYRNGGTTAADRAVVVLADTPAGLSVAAQAADVLGARVLRSELLEPGAAADAWLIAIGGADALIVELDSDGGLELDALLALIDRTARDSGIDAVICFPESLIDIVAAAIGSGRIALLCAPTMIERVAALQLAVQPRQPMLADIGSESEAQRLMQLSREVARIAKALAELSAGEPGPGPAVHDGAGRFAAETRSDPVDAATVRAVIRARRLRDQYLPAALFADPAWDMLLDLMAARLEGRPVAVSSLCIAAAVPPTTALRWIQALANADLIERRPDQRDGRRVFISLADRAAEAMQHYFTAARQAGAILA
ncbi:hypothetical protein ACMT1E_05595 [Sphingomonas flavalba]|uniref:hypothetical protein n=1 Tax=Sphingomonas flavalba TaxID=2559804 RepID=UPI0039E03F92